MPNQHGPTSRTGKLASCMNHLQHGSTAMTLFLKDENPNDFLALLENAFEQHQPAFDHDAALVTRAMKDHWLLLRRERTLNIFETALHERKPDYCTWLPADLHELDLFDRYKTAAARACTRSLKDLQTIQKMARDEQRWRHQLAREKQKLAIDLERFELSKQKEAVKQAAAAKEAAKEAEDAEPDLPPSWAVPPSPDAAQNTAQQILFIGLDEDNITTLVFEVTPSNDTLRRSLSDSDQVVRTYNFIGPVPVEYQHLVTPDAATWGDSTSVKKSYSFEEWSSLTSNE